MIRILLAYEIWRYEHAITKKELEFETADVEVTAHVSVRDSRENKPKCYRLS